MNKKNLSLYKIGAVLIAIALWCYVALLQNPTIEKIYTLPLEFVNVNEEAVILETDFQVQLRLSGTSDAFNKLETVNMHAIADLKGLKYGKHDVAVNVEIPENVKLVSRNPESVQLEIEEKKTEAFNISIEAGNPLLPEGYNAMDPIATPSIVYLTGAQKYLNQVDKVFVGINLSGLSETYKQSLPVQVMDTQGNIITSNFTITPSAIDVIVPIVADLPEKSVAVSVDYTGRPADDYVLSRIVVEPSTVSVYGELDLLNQILSVSTEMIDINGAKSDIIQTVKLTPDLGISLGKTDKVTVIMQIMHLETMTFDNIPVIVQNASEDSTVECAATVSVTLKGLASSLAKFNYKNLTVVVDVKALKPGSYNLPVEVGFRNLPSSDLSIVESRPNELIVNIVPKAVEPVVIPPVETTIPVDESTVVAPEQSAPVKNPTRK